MSDKISTVDSVGENKWIQVGDIRTGYRIYGSGDPLLMIMGYGSTMNLWESGMIDRLAARYKVIIFDNRGMGETEAGSAEFTIEQFADDCAGLLDALGIEKTHVLGWSMGSMIAQQLTLKHPDKVQKLVLYAAECDAEMFPPSSEVMEKITDASGTPQERGMRFISVLFPELWLASNGSRVRGIFFRPMGNIPPENIGKQSAAIGKWQGCCSRLAELKAPTLLVSGAEDVLVVPDNSRYLSQHIPNARLTLMDGGGHGVMFQFPEEFCAEVLSFLK
ncbi:MAG: alpha/beta hydrolase [Bacteroidota bacterium]